MTMAESIALNVGQLAFVFVLFSRFAGILTRFKEIVRSKRPPVLRLRRAEPRSEKAALRLEPYG